MKIFKYLIGLLQYWFRKQAVGKERFEIPKDPGAILSPTDNRDIAISAVQPVIDLRTLPEEYVIPYRLRISYQGIKPHCVGYATATMKEEKERREQIPMDFDGDWIYSECKKIDNYAGQGTFLRVAMKILKEKGAKPLNGSEVDAAKYKIGAYARVDDLSFAGLKSAIYQNGVIISLYRGSNQNWKSAYVKRGKEDWGHAVSMIGWKKDYLIFQNSWGEGWGDKGLGYVPIDYQCLEAWAILCDLPTDFELRKRPSHNFLNDLSIGMRNEEVKVLQDCLKFEDCFPIEIESTGYFGQITLLAVQKFQKKYGIIQTGYVGSLTRTKLNELF